MSAWIISVDPLRTRKNKYYSHLTEKKNKSWERWCVPECTNLGFKPRRGWICSPFMHHLPGDKSMLSPSIGPQPGGRAQVLCRKKKPLCGVLRRLGKISESDLAQSCPRKIISLWAVTWDRSLHYTSIATWQNSLNGTLKICLYILLYVNFTTKEKKEIHKQIVSFS